MNTAALVESLVPLLIMICIAGVVALFIFWFIYEVFSLREKNHTVEFCKATFLLLALGGNIATLLLLLFLSLKIWICVIIFIVYVIIQLIVAAFGLGAGQDWSTKHT